MKKPLFLAAIAALALFSCSEDAEQPTAEQVTFNTARPAGSPEENMRDFLENKAILLLPRVESKLDPFGETTAKSFSLISYSDITASSYIINGDEYNDLGEGNDEEANDGIYTSIGLYSPEERPFNPEVLDIRYSSEFKFHEQLKEELEIGTVVERKIPIKAIKKFVKRVFEWMVAACDWSYTYEGTSSLGFPCSQGGCVVVECW